MLSGFCTLFVFFFPHGNGFVGILLFEDSSAEQEDGVGYPQNKENSARDDGVEQ